MKCRHFLYILLLIVASLPFSGYSQPRYDFKIFQFPADKIPVIDGKADDWSLVPANYSVGADLLRDDRPDSVRHLKRDPKNIDVSVKAGWVKGMNRLYFLYEASDKYWDFSHPDLHNDIFELVVDGDHSGGPFITSFHPHKDEMDLMDNYFSFQGVQAQNYHIFTPAKDKDWAMVWGSQTWIKDLPYANAKSSYNFKPGDSGKYTLEFWITPFDYAGSEGPSRAVESVLKENNTVGLCWAIIDYDDVNKKLPENNGFWNLSPEHTMYGNATHLMPFKLMPLEKVFRKELEARWTFSVIDMPRRTVKFTDESEGKIDSWRWNFGDGTSSTEQHPLHSYKKGDHYVVTLTVIGKGGKSTFSRVWDVAVK